LPLKVLAVIAAVVTFASMEAELSRGAAEVTASKLACDKVASPLGFNSNPGTTTKPYATVEKLAGSLRPGQTGCLRAGVYQRDVKISKGGTPAAPISITSFPGERATLIGRLYVADEANNVVVQQLDLDGRNRAALPSPTVNGDNVVFRENDVTNEHTSICFLLGSSEWGRARGTLLEHNRIHDCGAMPPTNHHHGIYVEAAEDARIIGNWIYDNADRGIQLFPDAQRTYVAWNVIDGNGQGIVFSRKSANNTVEYNVLSNPLVRYNLETFQLSGTGNIARRNCVWSTRHWGNAGVQLDIEIPVPENLVTEPGFVNRAAKDFRLLPTSPCVNMASTLAAPKPPVVKAHKKWERPVRLRASGSVLWPGGRLLLRAATFAEAKRAAASQPPVLKVRRRGMWRRVDDMVLRGSAYAVGVRLAQKGSSRLRSFGEARIPRDLHTLRLRVYVRGAGHSNIVRVRVRG
jgi:nitrous oxidase accessory protein NosD